MRRVRTSPVGPSLTLQAVPDFIPESTAWRQARCKPLDVRTAMRASCNSTVTHISRDLVCQREEWTVEKPVRPANTARSHWPQVKRSRRPLPADVSGSAAMLSDHPPNAAQYRRRSLHAAHQCRRRRRIPMYRQRTGAAAFHVAMAAQYFPGTAPLAAC